MRWIEAVYEKPAERVAHDWYAPLPEPPEMYVRPEPRHEDD